MPPISACTACVHLHDHSSMPLARCDHCLESLFVALAIGLALPLSAQSIDEELPLPRWEREAPALPRISEPGSQFNSLLPTDSLLPSPPEQQGLLQSGPRLADAPPVLMPGYSELGPTDLSLFLHGSILQAVKPAHAPHQPTPVMSLRELPQELLTTLATRMPSRRRMKRSSCSASPCDFRHVSSG